MVDFSIVLDYEFYPVAVVRGHVELIDDGYNAYLMHCRCDEDMNITEAVDLAISNKRVGVVRTFGT